MAAIGLAPHADRVSAVEVARSTAEWLEAQGHKAVALPGIGLAPTKPEGVDDLDLVVSLGGDGTMLRTVGVMIGTGVPVLGVNFGRFGYLTAVEPDGLRRAIERFLAGDYELERRMTVDALIVPAGNADSPLRNNGDERRGVGPARGDAHDQHQCGYLGDRFLRYAADSMIVSTATGSTGYNLSARGPIISPKLRCLVLTPVAPHMLFDRSVVLDSTDDVSFQLEGGCAAELIVDGLSCGQVEVGERRRVPGRDQRRHAGQLWGQKVRDRSQEQVPPR